MTDISRELEQLYRRRHTVFRKTLACVTGDWESASDALQEGFARALAGQKQFRGDGSLEAWVWRICINQAHNGRRGLPTVPLDAADDVALPPIDGDPELADAVRALTPKRRLVVFLRYFADLSYDEIAAATGQRPGTVAATLNKARADLLEHLQVKEVTP